MNIIGISPLDKDSTVCLLKDGELISAVAEERLSRKKMHAGFPYLALQEIYDRYSLTSTDIDVVVYAFHDWERETQLMTSAIEQHLAEDQNISYSNFFKQMKQLPSQPDKKYDIPGLDENELYFKKSKMHNVVYKWLSTNSFLSRQFGHHKLKQWYKTASSDHKKWSAELTKGLKAFDLESKIQRVEHHLTHAANAYYTSGFQNALIVTLDGYGSGLGGSVSVGEGSKISRIHSLPYPVSLGEYYERVTSSLGFKPGRHEGKIVGLAAYESPDILLETVSSFFEIGEGQIHYRLPHNIGFSRYLATRFSKPAIAAAYQKVLEDVVCEYIDYYVQQTGQSNIVLSGGVVANVKANQRIFELDRVKQIYVHPNMGDGGCCVGAAIAVSAARNKTTPYEINDVYWGPEYSEEEILEALNEERLNFKRSDNIELQIASLLADGYVVARFNGRMEYGPRSLGNRSILYHAKDPAVNLWLNKKLNRTEFMPFAPATLFEERNKCYQDINGAEYTAMFMTITLNCTKFMKETCPAAVHVDGTARPQLVSEKSNKSFYHVINEYFKLTGIPSIINTSFNLHEEPIVCTPNDAIKAFKSGELPYLAIGPYMVKCS